MKVTPTLWTLWNNRVSYQAVAGTAIRVACARVGGPHSPEDCTPGRAVSAVRGQRLLASDITLSGRGKSFLVTVMH